MQVYEYIQYRRYLKDAYLKRKSKDKRFTHAAISELAGLKSTGFFSWVLSGKRNITPALTKQFSKVFEHDKNEAAYFLLLVNYDQAKTHELKAQFFKKIVSHKRSCITTVTPDQYAYFKEWYIPAIREIIAITPISDNYKKLGHSLLPKISPTEAKEATALLLRLGFITQGKNGLFKHVTQTITLGEEWRSIAVSSHQHALMQLGVTALEKVPRNERDISSVTLTCSDTLFKTYSQKLAELRQEFLELARQEQLPNRVIQLNLQLFPLTKKLDGDADV
ncbi:MAG: TIGR02147 family protein [Fibrobacterales bacterium]